jgi:SAM-dependent methyltransferase
LDYSYGLQRETLFGEKMKRSKSMSQSGMNDRNAFLEEYTEDDSIARYVTNTAGKGIQYILTHVYGPLYSQIIDSICTDAGGSKALRVLEYGCGAGMNLLYIYRLLVSKDLSIATAIGTDFSKPLIQTAEKEKNELIDTESWKKIKFIEASNESLFDDLTKRLPENESSLCDSFDLIVGVNTFRYAIRLHKQQDTANDIARLLAPGGYSIMIDMNNRFPFFRSRLRDRYTKPETQTWLPSLEEYTAPFREANLEIVEARHFCWIPHSAGSTMLIAARILTPFLNLVAPSFAMRSVVVARSRKISM